MSENFTFVEKANGSVEVLEWEAEVVKVTPEGWKYFVLSARYSSARVVRYFNGKFQRSFVGCIHWEPSPQACLTDEDNWEELPEEEVSHNINEVLRIDSGFEDDEAAELTNKILEYLKK